MNNNLESEIIELGKKVLEDLRSSEGSKISFEKITEKILEAAMKNEELKISMFRFIDVLPALNKPESVIRHVQEYFAPVANDAPEILRKALEINPGAVTSSLISAMIKKNVEMVARRFIAGKNPEDAMRTLKKIRTNGTAFTVDLLGEATLSDKESIAYKDRYLDLLDKLHLASTSWPENTKHSGHKAESAAVNISVKLSALYSQIKVENSEKCIDILVERYAEILAKAKEIGAFVYLDMEDSFLTSITIETYKKLMSSKEFANYPHTGIVIQAYLRRTEEDINQLIEWGKKRQCPFAIRLVKGAYWDTETILAKQEGWPIPVWQEKSSSDANYEKLTLKLLENSKIILPAFASHNIRSLSNAIKQAERLKLSSNDFEIQTLFGMGQAIKRVFSDMGYLVREYIPLGELIPGMGYLVRRLLENTSNEGFLRQSMHEKIDADTLMKKPEFGELDLNQPEEEIKGQFINSSLRDFSLSKNRQKLKEEIKKKLEDATEKVLPIVQGKKVECENVIKVTSPSCPDKTLTNLHFANQELSAEALDSLQSSFPEWSSAPIQDRAQILRKTAKILENKRENLAAIIVLESAKPWKEADADVAEAIDFLNYYAKQAVNLFQKRSLTEISGEENVLFYEPRGVTVAIGPWNFPLAIPCGMFAAALVTGNTVALKPAEQSSLIASHLFEAFLEAGMPTNVACFLPGIGEEIGDTLVNHPAVSTIIFTGSKDVGLSIIEKAAVRNNSNQHVKRVVAEMGGKNAIIVDDDADLDEAVKGVTYSAFGFQGQKCSACSRAIVLENNYEIFIKRLAESIKSITVSPPNNPSSYLGPLIDLESKQRVQKIVESAKQDCTLIAEGLLSAEVENDTLYIKPVAFADVPSEHDLLQKELFAPVLVVIKADSIEQALQIANNSEYGLTGAIYSRSPKNIAFAQDQFKVGNLYINRPSTGALVERQPFGGAKMSGVGSKAGGPDYLMQFVIPRVVTENTMRRGFAPM